MAKSSLSMAGVFIAGVFFCASVFSEPDCGKRLSKYTCEPLAWCKWVPQHKILPLREDQENAEKRISLLYDNEIKRGRSPEKISGVCAFNKVTDAQILNALQHCSRNWNEKTYHRKIGRKVIKLIIHHSYISTDKEVEDEADDYFNAMWKDHNQPLMQQVARVTKVAGYARKDGHLLVSMGSSTVNSYYMNTEGQIKLLRRLPFGGMTKPTDKGLDAKIQIFIEEVARIGLPVIMISAIGRALPEPDKGATFGNLRQVTGKLEGMGTEKPDNAKLLFNKLAEFIDAHNANPTEHRKIIAYVYRPNTWHVPSILLAKWVNTAVLNLVKQQNKLMKLVFFSGDWGGGGLSMRPVINGILQLGTENTFFDSKGKNIYEQDAAIEYFKLVGEAPWQMMHLADMMADAVFKWIENNKAAVGNQTIFEAFIAQTGKGRELLEKLEAQKSNSNEDKKAGDLDTPYVIPNLLNLHMEPVEAH